MRRRQQALIPLILAGILCAGNISSAVYAGETGIIEDELPAIAEAASTGTDSSEEVTNVESLDESGYDVWNDEAVFSVEMTEETADSYVMEDLMVDEESEEEKEYDNFMEEELSAAEDPSEEEIAAEGVCGTNVKWKLDGNGTLTIYSESDTPQPMSDYSSNGYHSDSPFYSDERIKSVIIGDNVSRIGDYAFAKCCKICSVELSGSVSEIGEIAFGECNSLSNIIIPEENNHFTFIDGVLYNKELTRLIFSMNQETVDIPDTITQIDPYAFKDCWRLTSIDIPNSVTKIGSYAFSRCDALTSITVPDSVTELGANAFSRCSALTSITISNSVTEIEPYTFWDCESLTRVVIPDSVIRIGKYAFGRCTGIKEIIPSENLKSIEEAAFGRCDGLKQFRIPESVQEIDRFAFTQCGLEEIIIPDGISVIEGNTFSYCYSLKKVFIPDTVVEIESRAFYDCKKLEKLFIPQSVQYFGDHGEVFAEYTNTTLYGYKGSCVEEYAKRYNLSFASVLYYGIVSSDEDINARVSAATIDEDDSASSAILIPYGNGITELIVAEADSSITSGEEPVEQDPIGEDNRTGRCGAEITWILDEQGVLNIKGTGDMYDYNLACSSPFYSSPLIRSVIIEEGVTSIGAFMFYSCENLESISIPDQVTKIGAGAFYGCSGMKRITVPSGVSVVNKHTYQACVNLSEVKYMGDVSYIGEYAFMGCKSLDAIPYFKSINSINYEAFAYCDGLKEILIPEGVEIIDNCAFSECKNVRRMTIPKSVLYTDRLAGSQLECYEVDPENTRYKSSEGVLYNKDGSILIACPPTVTELSLLDETTQIEDWAFNNCKIKRISNYENIERIGSGAFSRCTELLNVPVSSVTREIGEGAFSGCSNIKEVSIPESVTEIGQRAFAECSNLSEVRISGSITELLSYSFGGCQNLEKITLPSTVINIGEMVFADCSNLREIDLPASLNSIGEYAFRNCRTLSGITIPDKTAVIAKGAFSGCWNLGEIWIPDHPIDIGQFAFRDCYDIKIIRYSDQDFSESSPEYEERFGIDIHNDENGGLVDDQGNKYYFDEEATELYRLDESGGKTPVREYYRQKLIEEGFTANEINDFFAADIIEYHRATGDGEEDILSAAALSDLSVRGRYAFFVRKKKYLSAIANKQKRAQTGLNKSTKTFFRATVKISYRGTIYMTAGRKLRAPRVYGLKKGDSVSKWISSRKTVVRVNSKTGLLTAKRKGTAAITVITRYGARKSFVVKVTKPTVRFSKKKVTLKTGGSTTVLVRMVSGDKISSVRSSKKKVVRVVRLGKSIYLIAGRKGKAKITVRTKFGGKKTMKVVVKEAKK